MQTLYTGVGYRTMHSKMSKESFARWFGLELIVVAIAGVGIGYILAVGANFGAVILFVAGLTYAIGTILRRKPLPTLHTGDAARKLIAFGAIICGITFLVIKGASMWLVLANIGALGVTIYALFQTKV